MKLIGKQSGEIQKRIPKIIEYLGGKKIKSVQKISPPWETSTDAVIELLSALRRVNPELEKIARNEQVSDAAKSQTLIAELQVVQHLLQQLQQTF